uniref:F-box domain-containing protein n=1 Tax=Setaria viridis TaxID=4556 RepID=A0A4U6VD28_SETVI|nr:hypothetical protein SEVIR_3G093800v2 [Setaria viridis]
MAGASTLPRPRQRPRRCKHAWLPLDLLLEIAAQSDPATLVRCTATSKELHRHIADPAFRRRLHLRRAGRFVPSLLRGRLQVDRYDGRLRLVDNTTAHVTRLVSAAACFPPAADGETAFWFWQAVAARDGLILISGCGGWGTDEKLCVYCPATGRSQALPLGPRFDNGQYVLLVGDGEEGGGVGRPFQVLKACFVKPPGRWRSLQIHAFSSEQGTWAPRIRSSSPLIMYGDEMLQRPGNSVVVGDTVHCLYHLDRTYYVLKLHVKAARVTFTELPKSFHRACRFLEDRTEQILLATSSSGRSLIVLVANNDMISGWAQSERTGKWSKRPQFVKDCGVMKGRPGSVRLEWFAEKSGIVLVTAPDSACFFWISSPRIS